MGNWLALEREAPLLVGLVSAMALAACGASHPADRSSNVRAFPGAAPQTARAEPAKDESCEGATLATLPVQDSEGRWTAEIEAMAPPHIEPGSHFVSVMAELGWDGPVQCFVYPAPIEAGASISRLLGRLSSSVKIRGVRLVSIGNAGLDPILQLRAAYHAVGDESGRDKELKIAVVPRAEYPTLCLYDGAGYAGSFARVVTGFARSFRFRNLQAPPRRGELWYLSERNSLRGFFRFSEHALADGVRRTVQYSSNLIPIEEGIPSTEDQADVTTWDEQGSLVAGRFARLQNGRLSHRLRVERTADGWSLSGEVAGRPISSSFATSGPILGRLALEQRLSELTKQRPQTLQSQVSGVAFAQLEYWPLVEPARPVHVAYVAEPVGNGIRLRIDESLLAREFAGRAGAEVVTGSSSFAADASGHLCEISTRVPGGVVVAVPLLRMQEP